MSLYFLVKKFLETKYMINEVDVNSDNTSIVFTHLKYLTTRQHRSSRTQEQQTSLSATNL